MADLAITAASVMAGADAVLEHGRFGDTIIQGKVVFRDVDTLRYEIADNDGATALKTARGIALNAGADGQPGTIHRQGDLTIGAVLVPGTKYCLSSTAGGICPQADLGSGDKVVIIGVAKSAAVLTVNIQEPGVTL
jgi:hypothetical protein